MNGASPDLSTDHRLELLDGVPKELALRAGVDAGERLVRFFGGRRLYVPRKSRPGSELLEKLGEDAMRTLMDLYGGDDVNVPLGVDAERRYSSAVRQQQIVEYLRAQGDPQKVSKYEVAAMFGVSARTVQRVRARMRRLARIAAGSPDKARLSPAATSPAPLPRLAP
jgi:hypothetical protein